MDEITSWTLITQGKYAEACEKAEREYAETQAAPSLRHKVLSLMQLGQYQSAINTCRFAIANSKWGISQGDFTHRIAKRSFLMNNDRVAGFW